MMELHDKNIMDLRERMKYPRLSIEGWRRESHVAWEEEACHLSRFPGTPTDALISLFGV